MIPAFQDLMLPILELANANGSEPTSNRDFIEALADRFQLAERERKELLASGRQSKFENRVYWALVHLRRGGLIESAGRGVNRITQRGREILNLRPGRIDIKFLNQFPEFREFRASRTEDSSTSPTAGETGASPEETLDAEYQKLRRTLAAHLSEKLRHCSPSFFERLVVELLVKMGYGGSRADAGQAVGRSGDGGIDGIIKEDRLGLDTIYIQAKRWTEGSVGRREVQQFAGALQGQRGNKGIYITTSSFTKDARDYVSTIGSKIVLIDGAQLAEMMIDFDLGVSTVSTYEIKKVDNDYFAE